MLITNMSVPASPHYTATAGTQERGEGFPGTASSRGTLICRDTGGQIRAEARSCGALALSSVHIGPSFMWQRGYLCQYLKRLSRHRSRVSGRAGLESQAWMVFKLLSFFTMVSNIQAGSSPQPQQSAGLVSGHCLMTCVSVLPSPQIINVDCPRCKRSVSPGQS